MGQLLRDLRYALRQLRKDVTFTSVVVISLALAIGANTTIFTFVNSFLLRPPAVENAAQLRELWNHNMKASGIEAYSPLSYPDYIHYRDHNQVFSGLMAFDGEMRSVSWSGNGTGEMVKGQLVSGNFFSVLGIRPFLGRTFLLAEDRAASANPVIVISYPFWREHLGADRGVLGRALTLNGTKFTVVGVSPANFTSIIVGNQPDFWAPLTTTPLLTHDNNFLSSSSSFWLFAIGRLGMGINAAQAEANLSTLSFFLQQAAPDSHKDVQVTTFPVKFVPEPLRGYVSAFTGLLMVVVGMVLLIACTNAASLMLANGVTHLHEFAIRSALGATRGRLIRQMLTESVLLSVMSGILGTLLAVWVIPLLLSLKPPTIPVRVDAPMDWRVLCFSFGLALITGLAFGMVPALRSTRLDLTPILKAKSHVAAFSRFRLRSVLVVAQVAVCMVLLVSAGLCVRSLINAQSIDPGFDTRHIVIAQLDPGALGYSEEQGKNFYEQLLRRVEALPGVTSASLASFLPLGTSSATQLFTIDGYQAPAGQRGIGISVMNVGSGFFQTMSIPLLKGRAFNASDKNVVVINEAMANHFWPGLNPIGKHIRAGNQGLEIVGVVSTGKYRTLSETAEPFLYLPIGYQSLSTLVVRTQMDPKSLLPAVRREIQTLDPNVVPVDIETMKEYMELPLFPAHATGLLLGTAGLLALVLALTGLYGVVSYTVSQRIHEIGVRMSLGAARVDILRMVVRQGLLLTSIGMAIGLAGAFAVTRVLSSLLYGIGATDATTFVAVSLLLLTVTFLASYIPARRASKVDPMIALRYE